MRMFDWAAKRHEQRPEAGLASAWRGPALGLLLVLAVGLVAKPALAEPLQWYKVPAEGAGTAVATSQAQPTVSVGHGTVVAAPPIVQPPRPASPTPQRYDDLITDVARRHALDPLLVHAVVATESAYRPAAVSGKGAVGLMQVMPATGARFGKTSLAEPRDNLEAGSAYLSWLVQRFGGRLDLALAGYNAGEGAVARYGNAVPPYAETQAYVHKVLAHYASLRGDGAVTVPAAQPAVLRLAAPQPTPTPRRAAGSTGDVGQLWRLFTGGSARTDAAPVPRI